MKRIFFRVFLLAAIAGLGMLAIAHAQRTSPDGNSPNPLRIGQSNAVRADDPGNYRSAGVGPVDTDVPPHENPLRNQRVTNDGNLRPASHEEPVNQGQMPDRIRMVVDGPNATSRGGSAPVSGGEPGRMPATDDRYAAPMRASEGQNSARSPASPPLGGTSPGPRFTAPDTTGSYFPGSTRDAIPDESAASSSGGNGTGQPGDKQLEGPQIPQVNIQKIAPPEIQVGRPAVLRVVVRNTGQVIANDVEIHDQVPRGSRLLGTAPPASHSSRGELVWSLGSLKPGSGTTVEMQIMPTEEGEVGSVAAVRFQTEASARSRVTRPKLVVETAGANRVLAGDTAMLTFTVSNPGSGVATGVTLTEHIPSGLRHPTVKDAKLIQTVGDLKPGESRQLQLPLKAIQPGKFVNQVTASADASLQCEHRHEIEVTSPQLDVAVAGPKRRYLEREATYQLSISNPGTASARQVELVAYLPPGLKYVNANNSGRYDQATRAVSWRMDELPVNQHGTVELVTLPIEPGQFSIKVHGAAQRGLTVDKEQPVQVEGLAAVLFQLSHTKDPLEIGGETTYEISVVNQGSKASSNLQISVYLPAELKPLAVEGPTRYTIEKESNKVVFEGLPQLAPKSVAAFRVRAQGLRAGDLRVRCQLMTDEMQQPVVKEESTRVYADE